MKRIALSIAGAVAIALSGFSSLAIAPVPVRAEISVKANEIASGSFVTVDEGHPTTGTATIIEENGQKYIELSETFATVSGPAVVVALHRNNTVGVNLNAQDYTTIATLKSFNGVQRYAIPETVNVDDYSSVVIWCAQFNVTFGYAAL